MKTFILRAQVFRKGIETEDISPRIYNVQAETYQEAVDKFYKVKPKFNAKLLESYNIYHVESIKGYDRYGKVVKEFEARLPKKRDDEID